MTTQRMGTAHIPAADAHVAALFYVAAALTVICGGLAIAAVVAGWPSAPVVFSVGVMIVTWNAAFERRRRLAEQHREEIDRSISAIERMLWEW
jgi:Flp pilus assembly protein TadB